MKGEWFTCPLIAVHPWSLQSKGGLPVSCSTLASITRHYASSAYPRRDYKFGQNLSWFLSFALPFADTNDHHGTSSYIIQQCIIIDQHPLHWELPSTSQVSPYTTVDQHIPIYNFTSLLLSSHSYPPIPSMNKTNLPYIPINPLYPPWCWPSPQYQLGEDT